MSTLERAIEIAARAHAGQRDKAEAPYILIRYASSLRCGQQSSGLLRFSMISWKTRIVERYRKALECLEETGF